MATTARQQGSMSPEFMRTLNTIFKRCVQCPPESPRCHTCPNGQICSLIPQTCAMCAHVKCVDNPTPTVVSHGPNVGAIAGGVVGGVAFIALVVACVYFFWIKKRKAEQDAELEEEWAQDDITSQKRSTQFTAINDAASTRTRGSLAASILSRASNIIQIAYIPGVTNRNGGSGHTSIHAPVPPIPAAHRPNAPKSPLSNEGDALFFRPDSTWSGTSSINSDRRDTQYTINSHKRDTQYTMASISPSLMRDSIASDIFMDDASATPMPASAATRLAPRMVSVKSNTSSPSAHSSGVPSPDESGGQVKTLQVLMPGQGSSLSPSSSFGSAGKIKQVTVSGAKGRFPVRQPSDASTATSRHAPTISSPLAEQDDTLSNTSTLVGGERSSLIQNKDFRTPPAVQQAESPFFDASELVPAASPASRPNPYASMGASIGSSREGPKSRRRSIGGLSAVEEEAMNKRLSRTSEAVEEADETKLTETSPFADEHAIE